MQLLKHSILILSCFFLIKSSYCQNRAVEDAGDITQILLPVSALTFTLIKKDKKGSWQFLKSFGTNILITRILKASIKKERPEEKWSFDSFPSGHTSTAFSGASFIQRRYGWKYGIPAYILATYTGFSRVYAKKHYTIDVLAGAIIGIGSTYIFTTPYQQEHLQLTFNQKDKNYTIGLIYKF